MAFRPESGAVQYLLIPMTSKYKGNNAKGQIFSLAAIARKVQQPMAKNYVITFYCNLAQPSISAREITRQPNYASFLVILKQ